MHRTALPFLVVAFLAAGCALPPGGASPAPTGTPAPTSTVAPSAAPVSPPPSTPAQASPSAIPSPSSSSTASFYLRGWYTQAIAPQYTFPWLPPMTISDGVYINGNVAVPTIFPGPLLILPVSRSISDAGIQSIIDDAHSLGLLKGNGDFAGNGAQPGAKLVNLDMLVGGVTHHLVGVDQLMPCDPAACAPGTPAAFTTFWNQLLTLDTWLPKDLGESQQYTPERIALLLTQSADPPTLSPRPTLVEWPLTTPLASFGNPYLGQRGMRCATLSGDDLVTLLPVLRDGTQLTAFYEGKDVWMPTARALVPGEPSPCDAGL